MSVDGALAQEQRFGHLRIGATGSDLLSYTPLALVQLWACRCIAGVPGVSWTVAKNLSLFEHVR